MKKDLDLVRICSYLFFDGHLYQSLKCFYLSSKNEKDLKKFETLVKRKFKTNGRYYFNDGGAGINKTHKYRIFSKKICEYLEKLGVPKGAKTTTSYTIPEWIMKNRKFSREFIRIAYLCEGSMKEKRKNPRITINMNKSEKLLENGIEFMEQIRKILEFHNIETTEVRVYNTRSRKDGVKVKLLRLRVITKDNNKFIKIIGWLK